MDATTVGLLGIVALLVLIFMGMNIGMALMAVGFFGFAIMTNFKAAISVLSTVPSTQAGSYSMIVVPLFILMGSFAYRADCRRACSTLPRNGSPVCRATWPALLSPPAPALAPSVVPHPRLALPWGQSLCPKCVRMDMTTVYLLDLLLLAAH